MKVVLLGTGTPNCEPDRAGACTAVIAGGEAWLVDAGAGVVRRAAAAAQSGVEELAPARLARLLLTHLHSDHTVGLPDLLLSPWTLGRERPLLVWGPEGSVDLVAGVRIAYEADIRIRIDGSEPCNRGGCEVEVSEIGAGSVVESGGKPVISAFAVAHGTCRGALGYRFDLDGRSIVVTGDTAPCESLVEAAAGCDVLVSEVYSQAALAARPEQWRRYHRAWHTSGHELGELASRCGAGKVVLTHQLAWGAAPESIVGEVESSYQGEVVWGEDLMVVECG